MSTSLTCCVFLSGMLLLRAASAGSAQGPAAATMPFWDHLAQATDLITDRGAGLTLILVDVTGDGRTEIFIAPAGLCGNGGCSWSTYSPTGRRNELIYLGEISFSAGSYRFDPATRTLTHCSPVSATACTLGTYQFSKNTIQSVTIRECSPDDSACRSEVELIRTWQTSRAPAVLKAIVAQDDVIEGLRWADERTGRWIAAPGDLDSQSVIIVKKND